MKILVTGGAGFIGSALIRHIIKETSHSVINIDKLTYAGNLESLAEVAGNSRYLLEQVDICALKEIRDIFNRHRPDMVIHLAAESHVDRSIDGPGEFIQTNIIGTYNLLKQASAYWKGLDGKKRARFRFHHVSTDEVYGELPHPDQVKQTERDRLPLFTEETPYAPSSPYSASKASADHLVRAWHRTYGLPTLISNSSNNYGPYQFPEKLVPLMILSALAGKPLPVYGRGNQIRDWLYVQDHVRALLLVAARGRVGETYNIGGNNEKKNIEVVRTICSILDDTYSVEKNPNINHSSGEQTYRHLITFVPDRPGHDRRYAIDADKIRGELGWQPEETFESGLRKTVLWYLRNRSWWQKVQNGSYRGERLGTQI